MKPSDAVVAAFALYGPMSARELAAVIDRSVSRVRSLFSEMSDSGHDIRILRRQMGNNGQYECIYTLGKGAALKSRAPVEDVKSEAERIINRQRKLIKNSGITAAGPWDQLLIQSGVSSS